MPFSKPRPGRSSDPYITETESVSVRLPHNGGASLSCAPTSCSPEGPSAPGRRRPRGRRARRHGRQDQCARPGGPRRPGHGTTVVDLPGGTLLPAFGDGRVHPVMGDLGLLGAPVRKCTSVDGIVEAVRHWADGHPEAEWITGDGFDAWLAPGPRISFDSDWPVTDLEPLRGIATAVTRQTPAGIPDGGRLRQERIAISTALAAHSAGCAHQAFEETEWGVPAPRNARRRGASRRRPGRDRATRPRRPTRPGHLARRTAHERLRHRLPRSSRRTVAARHLPRPNLSPGSASNTHRSPHHVESRAHPDRLHDRRGPRGADGPQAAVGLRQARHHRRRLRVTDGQGPGAGREIRDGAAAPEEESTSTHGTRREPVHACALHDRCDGHRAATAPSAPRRGLPCLSAASSVARWLC